VIIQAHKIASVVHRLGLGREVELIAERRRAHVGDVVAVRAKAEKQTYGELELAEGRMAKVFLGDVIVGALGARRALKGFVGSCPSIVAPGDELVLLNLGGVIGVAQGSGYHDLGSPCPVEFLGFVAIDGQAAKVPSVEVPPDAPKKLPPLIVVSGTCMSAGKTRAACEIIHELSARGIRINGAKLTGVACRRDLLVMEDHGARRTTSFIDFGLVSTVNTRRLARVGRQALSYLATDAPDMIVLELGDGIMGDYGVMEILRDLRGDVGVHVFCATDPVGAWGGKEFLAKEGIGIDIVSGPSTDTIVGVSFMRTKLGVPAINACADPRALGKLVLKLMGERR
jgi:hypothetical protein